MGLGLMHDYTGKNIIGSLGLCLRDDYTGFYHNFILKNE